MKGQAGAPRGAPPSPSTAAAGGGSVPSSQASVDSSTGSSAAQGPRGPKCIACQNARAKCSRTTPCTRCVERGLGCAPSFRRPGRPLNPITRAWQLSAGDWPAYHEGGEAALAPFPAPARAGPGQTPFLGGLAPSYTLAFVRHLLDGRVALERAWAVLQSWWYLGRGRGQDCTGGHLAAFSKILGWEEEFAPGGLVADDNTDDPDGGGSGSGAATADAAAWTTRSPAAITPRAANAAATAAAALALSAASGGGGGGAEAGLGPASPVGFKRAEASELCMPEAPPKRTRAEVSDATTAPAQSPPASYIGADVPRDGGKADAVAAAVALGVAAAAAVVAGGGKGTVASADASPVPAGGGAGPAMAFYAVTGQQVQQRGSSPPVPSGTDRISDELRLSSPSMGSGSGEGNPGPAQGAVVGVATALLPSAPPVLARQHVGIPFPLPPPLQPPAHAHAAHHDEEEREKDEAKQPPPPVLEDEEEAAIATAAAVAAVAPPAPFAAVSPPRPPSRTGLVTSPIPVLPPLSDAPEVHSGGGYGQAAFASCGVAWMFSEEEEAQGFPPYLEISCCPNFAAHFLSAEELRALIELQYQPIEHAWGSLVVHTEPLAPSPSAAAAAAVQQMKAAATAGGGDMESWPPVLQTQQQQQQQQMASAAEGGADQEEEGLGAFYLTLCAATFCRPPEVSPGRRADFGKASARLRMLVRDGPEAPTRRACPFDARIVHYVTDDGRYSAWTLELDALPNTLSHATGGLAQSLAAFQGCPETPPPTLQQPPELAAAAVGMGGGGPGAGLGVGVEEAKRGGEAKG